MYEVWAERRDGTKIKLDQRWTLADAQRAYDDWRSRFSWNRIWIQ